MNKSLTNSDAKKFSDLNKGLRRNNCKQLDFDFRREKGKNRDTIKVRMVMAIAIRDGNLIRKRSTDTFGTFDAIASVTMFEHVGSRHYRESMTEA